jgi:hypothetical protein
LPTSLRLSQTCLCGAIVRKSLSERVHSCPCGIIVQRDVWSAYLARFCVAVETPEGVSWRLDADQANAVWSGVESRFPTASSPAGVEAFVAWAWAQSASGDFTGSLHLPPCGDAGQSGSLG